ncbi:acyl transferase/acyl hydrolase/lysophospholipase [Cokeromyces recurvatus]|uniref:acyl transferase/acyl hydrolase/lysophospholipase n=1 Tax=Cokeromyces recurvatus TaxID=90255 RepID=UPI00221F7601|nr:acyl transferase/acyl hydrolase/lysophospholipase [Cokeromyces recurvatus]KAI7898671.1 acyl transferase/acyl hydrolase/lysophospholipase [Cokeromyces recurvatus]
MIHKPNKSKLALATLISISVLGTVYYKRKRRGYRDSKDNRIDPKDKLIDNNSLYNNFVASLPTSFLLIETSSAADTFLNKLFSSINPANYQQIIPTSYEELKAQIASLYPTFENQLEAIRDMYHSFWDYLTFEDFRNMAKESMKEDNNPNLHPEIQHNAYVREGQELSEEEIKFAKTRKQKMKAAFAFFIGVNENEVEIEDIPNIGIASSGGGYRAMVSCSGYLHAMYETGILDCVLYMAGVSGSTWAMSQLYSPLTNASFDTLKDHLSSRIHTHIANLSNFLNLLNASRHNAKIILHGIIQRYYQQNKSISLVDIFGMLLGGTLLAKKITISENEPEHDSSSSHSKYSESIEYPSIRTNNQTTASNNNKQGTIQEDSGLEVKPRLLHNKEIKLSKQREYFEDGSLPMPIYCVVRHEVETPNVTKAATVSSMENNREPCEQLKIGELDKYHDKTNNENKGSKVSDKEEINSLYQWFEFTPYEMGSEEINAWIPIWAFGRKFEDGKNLERLPEQSLGILMGVFGSAFVASLAHFYQEIRLLLPASAVQKADEIIKDYQSSVLSTIHPISPASFPNPFYKMPSTVQTKDKSKEEILRSKDLVESEQIELMDAGMDNNIPFYPLLRRGRDVDIIIVIDSSADIQETPYFDRAMGYVKHRGIKGWPTGAGWPKPKNEKKEEKAAIEASSSSTNIISTQENMTHTPIHVNHCHNKNTNTSTKITNDEEEDKSETTASLSSKITNYALDTCTIFESNSLETTPAKSTNDINQNTTTTTYPENTNPITLVYFPLIVNKNYDPEFDPQTAEFCSTWNFVYSSEQVNKLHGLAKANIKNNLEKVRKVIRETWKRKRDERLKREKM